MEFCIQCIYCGFWRSALLLCISTKKPRHSVEKSLKMSHLKPIFSFFRAKRGSKLYKKVMRLFESFCHTVRLHAVDGGNIFCIASATEEWFWLTSNELTHYKMHAHPFFTWLMQFIFSSNNLDICQKLSPYKYFFPTK